MLINNINIIRNKYLNLWKIIQEKNENTDSNEIEVIEAKSGAQTLVYKNNNNIIYLLSKYDPIKEANTIINQYSDIDENTHVVFYGIGLGYHVEAFSEKYPNVGFSIYEPVPEIMWEYLSKKEISQLSLKNLINISTEYSELELENFCFQLLKYTKQKTIVIEPPSYKRNFVKQYNAFILMIQQMLQNKSNYLSISNKFQKRWTINSIFNLRRILCTPNLLMQGSDRYKGKPAVLVSAGPSLNDEIHHLRYIKENKLAYIFAVGSSINALIENNIYPDAAFTYDPSFRNKNVYQKVIDNKIKEIPLIFGSTVGYSTAIEYPGDKCHVITSLDELSSYYLKSKSNQIIPYIQDTSSVATFTLQILHRLEFYPIILVGQNFAYKDKKQYAKGISYQDVDTTQSDTDKSIIVEDVMGNGIYTNSVFNDMRLEMEAYIKSFNDTKIINTTKNGAKIEGASFLPMEEVIKEYLPDRTVEKDWLPTTLPDYDIQHLRRQHQKMTKEYYRVKILVKEFEKDLSQLQKYAEKNYPSVLFEKEYKRIYKMFLNIEKNQFFKVFLMPMNRSYYEMLPNMLNDISHENNQRVKAKKIESCFMTLINSCKLDLEKLGSVFNRINETIAEKEKGNLFKRE